MGFSETRIQPVASLCVTTGANGLLGGPDTGERHIREGRQMYPNTGGKTITTIAAQTA
jgi:hypothetical protein